MDEQHWLDGNDPLRMMSFLAGRASQRKRRLFACACCRRVPYLICESPSHADWAAAVRASVSVGELLADGMASPQDLERCLGFDCAGDRAAGAFLACADTHPAATFVDVSSDILFAVTEFVFDHGLPTDNRSAPAPDPCDNWEQQEERAEQAALLEQSEQMHLLRCIFGNPFRPFATDPSWKTPSVIKLATTIYTDRQLPSGLFDNQSLAILADALEDAGCDNADILNHLRSNGDHVRGCWVVDLVLGKE